ncbi:uridine kinase [Corallincola platygyrae]
MVLEISNAQKIYIRECEKILGENNLVLISITGPSGSGKTTFAKELHQAICENRSVILLSEDNYYKANTCLTEEQKNNRNYDHPSAFDHKLLEKHLKQLKAGDSVKSPIYCYKTHQRKERTVELRPADFIIVEGIMLLNKQYLRELFDLKVFMDVPLDICLLRRIQRDINERGRTLNSVAQQYLETVRPMHNEFIKPQKNFADFTFSEEIDIDFMRKRVMELILL